MTLRQADDEAAAEQMRIRSTTQPPPPQQQPQQLLGSSHPHSQGEGGGVFDSAAVAALALAAAPHLVAVAANPGGGGGAYSQALHGLVCRCVKDVLNVQLPQVRGGGWFPGGPSRGCMPPLLRPFFPMYISVCSPSTVQILVTFTTCLRAGMVSGMGLPDAHLLVAQLEQYIFEVGSSYGLYAVLLDVDVRGTDR